ncbi:MAG: cysG 2 [Sporomusa sp.]|nr:cysG 2 [Sporomusa sp.]
MELYPINLKLAGRRCAVVGGGAVAERKAIALHAAGAEITVFSPALTPGLSRLHETGLLVWVPRAYQANDLPNFFLVFCATNHADVNQQAAVEARASGALVNIADAPELSDFYVPAHIAQGDLLITVSTGGGSPALAKCIKEDIAAQYGPEYGQYLALIAKVRTELKARLATAKARENFWRGTIDHEALYLLKEGKFSEAEERIRHAACCTGTES